MVRFYFAPVPQGDRERKTSPSLSAAMVGAVATKLGGEVCPVNGNTVHMSRHCDPIGGAPRPPMDVGVFPRNTPSYGADDDANLQAEWDRWSVPNCQLTPRSDSIWLRDSSLNIFTLPIG